MSQEASNEETTVLTLNIPSSSVYDISAPAVTTEDSLYTDVPLERTALDYALRNSVGPQDHDGHAGDNSHKVTRFMMICCACACLNSLLLGYNVGVSSVSILYMQDYFGFSDLQTEILLGAVNAMSIIGALATGRMADILGRLKIFTFASVFFLLGTLLVTLGDDYAVLLIGRISIGLGLGVGLSIDPLYISELSPAQYRGHLVTYSEIANNIGILGGYSSVFAFKGLSLDMNWRVMNGMGIFAPVAMILLAIFWMPESPRWLLQRDFEQEAVTVLGRSCHDQAEVQTTVDDLKAIIAVDRDADKLGWSAMLDEGVRIAVITGIGTAVCQQISGDEAILLYTPIILNDAGFDSRTETLLWTSLIGLFKVSGIFVGMHYLDLKGRRPLLLLSIAGLSLMMFGFASSIKWDGPIAILIPIMCASQFFFSVGMGPGTWLVAAEVFPLHIRSKGMSLSAALNRGASSLVTLTFLSLKNALTLSGTFYLYAFLGLASFAFIFFFLPETKGLTLEQVQNLFENSRRPFYRRYCSYSQIP